MSFLGRVYLLIEGAFLERKVHPDTALGRYTGLDQESQHEINHEPCRVRSDEHPYP